MLEGLEIKTINYLDSLKNKDFRIDSQFHTQEPIKNSTLVYEKIGNLLSSSQYGISISMNESGVGYPIYRMNEIHNMLCDTEVLKSADISNIELNTFKLNDRDVLFNRTNSFEWVGRTGLYKQLNEQSFVFASYLVRFVPNQEFLLPEFLTAFLNSKFGVQDIKRRARQSINQTNVNPEEVKAIEIPILSMEFQRTLKSSFDKSVENKIRSESLYHQAEQLLLQEIGLANFTPSQEGINIKSFKDSFVTSGRLDAEYYQPKYDDYLNKVLSYSKGALKIRDCCYINGKNYNPTHDKQYKYIELSNIGKSGDIDGFTLELGRDLPSRARRLVNKNDVLISSIEGSLDSCGLITEEYDQSLCSTGFYVLNSDQMNSETLLVLFKSSLMQSIMKQNCSGTILTAMNKDDFLNIYIPIIDLKIQQQIADLVEESFALKQQSEHLLEVAKRAVEIAIEESEEVALRFIEEEGL